jgi:glucose/mannose-6-phosphate isomerase
MSTVTAALDSLAVAAADPTAQARDITRVGAHLRDAVSRIDAAGLEPIDAPGGLVVAGMGGSAAGARLATAVLGGRLRRPMVVADGYELPSWAGPDTVVLCSSYSGNTEEALACYEEGRAGGARLVAATTGGRLAERAAADGVPVIVLPAGLQPRAAVGYSLVAALETAALAGAAPSVRGEVGSAAELADILAAAWGPGGPDHGPAKTLARALSHTIPIIVGAGLTAPVAYRWKCQLNENAKLAAFSSVLPEADHNEICAWASAGALGPFSTVFLDYPGSPDRLALRIGLTFAAAARARMREVHRVAARGSTALERLVSLVLLGDLVSLFVAVLRGVDPGEIAAISELKVALAGQAPTVAADGAFVRPIISARR